MSGLMLAGTIAGGVGLFLLGMSMMTEGLKLAAGRTLERILARSTRTRLRGLLCGVTVTAVVQSSSAVTVATIGFVNAGLLGLSQALWVLFGANVGTTMTSWLVALVGLKFKIEALALPLIGVGMLLRLLGEGGEGSRRRGAGAALAGFGILFLGIDVLKGAFTGLPNDFTLPATDGLGDIVTKVGIGVGLTVLMQSSSAALVVALTAAESGLLSMQGAAAVVIGANVGTTVTALIASIGATPNAKRAATAHILFNVLTGLVALTILPWLVGFLRVLGDWIALDATVTARLALFHTAFNVLGVVLIWPFAQRLTAFLEARFKRSEEDEANPRFLDRTVLAVPPLALDALDNEVRRMGEIAIAALRDVIDVPRGGSNARHKFVVARLKTAIADFVTQLHRSSMSAPSARRLPEILRVARYYETATDLAQEVSAVVGEAEADSDVAERGMFREAALALLRAVEPGSIQTESIQLAWPAMEEAYQAYKGRLLADGAAGRMTVTAMDVHLRAASAIHRALEQSAKAARLLTKSSVGLDGR